MTNADNVRAMSDEELADILQGQCACCAYQLTGCTERECKDGRTNGCKRRQRPMTNGDKIRQMTNSQISEMFVFVDTCSMCTGADSVYCGEPDFCKHSIEKWLEQEVEENTGSKTV